jgi:hypothetical protein
MSKIVASFQSPAKQVSWALAIALLLVACQSKNIPDVSDIKVDLQVVRFEKELFAADTNQALASMKALAQKYPDFAPIFFTNIAGMPLMDGDEKQLDTSLRMYVRTLAPVRVTAEKLFPDDAAVKKDVERALQFVKYYFKNYPLPKKIYTYIAPFDFVVPTTLLPTSDVIGKDFLGIGLQSHLGSDYPVYSEAFLQEAIPRYITQRFTPQSIGANVVRNIIDDLFPYNAANRPLVEQMIEKGKRVYLQDLLLPEASDTVKLGYSKRQLEGCLKNEAAIWNLFVQNDLLYSKDPTINKEYIEDGPKTAVLSDDSPGNIGLFVGWQIVKKFIDKKGKDFSPEALMKTDPQIILSEAKYKPK